MLKAMKYNYQAFWWGVCNHFLKFVDLSLENDWSDTIFYGNNKIWRNNPDPTFLEKAMWFFNVVDLGFIDFLTAKINQPWSCHCLWEIRRAARDQKVFTTKELYWIYFVEYFKYIYYW